ncbi:transcription factor HIVEP3 isoform X1 [Sander lucioperca]|uniref:transcription factor HIVEP3 isoform X1 n=1 Tax=Sander lucioperca TaxID=283035 RepID=UPI001653BF2F|nr:transcription factor HIVEP3 isoform X1 [Sander lucioperca]XP_035848716.1 transcription factor HIVEP3 isoform X1 [Sander lucioperca]XP_035848717.1 transcription factor HIVEP3 isoform X1 [Sander lucioperca]
MEALHSRLTTGEQSGGQEHCQPESPHRGPQPKSPSKPRRQQRTGSPKSHGTLQQPKQSRRQPPERKRLRHQRQSLDSDTALEHKHEATTATAVSSLSPGVPCSSAGGPTQSKPETQEGTPKQKRERKPQRPGKYVCTYCGRACAKPSVLQKHIRSHTGERPYPCAPCGFSFKTKSNLYKHRKSHTHKVKAGLALGEPRSLEEQVTESEDETRQLSSASSLTERRGSEASIKNHETDGAKDCTRGNDDSYAVKKRLALRLSRGKRGPLDSSDEKTSSLSLGSKGSTESGYFSRSESTEQTQDSPPNTSAKSYAEIILGKYGRLGHLQRMSRHHNQLPSGQEEKSIPFTVPKKQVIDHITKLITINEAVVDTSKIDSVKPRRFSLSRKNSSESQKSSSVKETLIHSPKVGDLGYKNSGSITMGVPCEKFHHPSLNVEQLAGQTSTAPLVRSHSMPSAASSFDASSGGLGKFRLSQSFDERQPSETQASRRYGMLRRQPAIEIPLGAELTKEEHEGSHSLYPDRVTTVPDHTQSPPQPYECEACGTGCNDWEGYKKHKQSLCLAHHPRNEVVVSQTGCSQLINHAVRAGASAMRKRRKEESLEFDDPSSPSLPSPALLSGQCKDESSVAYEGPRRLALQTCSVIQHTSSFEKQESLCNENQGTEATINSPPQEDYQPVPQKQSQQSRTLTTTSLVRQHSVRVPEILVTEDSNMSTATSKKPTTTAKHSEKPDEFQWPQRSPSLAQLPIEKLPPKKKRLRLAEAAQSSGESSFDSISLPHSPSQDSSASYASSRSTSFEESNRPDMEMAGSTPLRRSRAPHMLTVPGVHQHREMRRSASEQAPHDPQPSVLMAESRSKSFDYSCLSPERSAVGWRERRKCLLMRHTAIRDPDEEEHCTVASRSPEHVSSTTSSQASPTSVYCSRSPTSPSSGDAVLRNPVRLQCKEIFSQWKLSQNIQLTGSTELPSVDPVKEEASHTHTEQPPPQAAQPYPTHGPSGAARARYLPMSTGLKLEIPLLHSDYSEAVRVSPSHIQRSVPHIIPSLELLRPVTSPAVAVRLQTDTLTLACAIYTTFSQSTSPGPQEAVDAVSHNIGIPTAEYRNHRNISPDVQLWFDDGLRTSGSGGNKRMLSPSNSMELPPESQQQQKRVKEEEEEGEVGCVDKASVDTCNQEVKRENQTCLPSVCSPITHGGPSYPSLLSSTCNSWCYLNYIKPNPSALDEQKPSVYSSWSTNGYDPNPPGLSSKTALSLLHCKQRLSPSIYTISPMSVRTTESMEQEDSKRPCSTEVYNSQSYCRDNQGTNNGQQSADEDRSNRKEEADEEEEEEEEEKNEEEEVHSCSRNKQPPEVWISERVSNEKYGVMHGGGGGGGECQCKDCGFHLKNTSVLQKCTHRITESPPSNCKHCNLSLKAKGSLVKHLRSEARGKETCCYPDGNDEGVCGERSLHPDKQKDSDYSDLGKSRPDEDDNGRDKDGRRDEDNRSKAAESSHTASSDSEKPESSQSIPLPPKDSTQKSSASARRALFARRRFDASTSASSGGSRSPGTQPVVPQREPSPPRSPPPGPHSPSSCHVSPSALRPVSPVRSLSPIIVQSHGLEFSGPPGCLADTSAPCRGCLHPRGRQSTARLSVDEFGLSHIPTHPARPRRALNVLSHLPLHSQGASRSPSLLIPIGGIHMIQPRSTLPLYSLVSSPVAATASLAGTSWRLRDAPKGRFPPLQRHDTLEEPWQHGQASPQGGMSGSGRSDALLHRNRPSPGTETRHLAVDTDAHVTERCVYPETTQGQKKAPSSQTQH